MRVWHYGMVGKAVALASVWVLIQGPAAPLGPSSSQCAAHDDVSSCAHLGLEQQMQYLCLSLSNAAFQVDKSVWGS